MTSRLDLIGSGLAGPLAATLMARAGVSVTCWDRRPDPRVAQLDAGRSINLALSVWGLKALAAAGLEARARALCLPMKGRLLHSVDGETRFVPYGSRPDHVIHSISRQALNQLLLSAAEHTGLARLEFSRRLHAANLDTGELDFRCGDDESPLCIKADHIIGSDGSGSVLRDALGTHAPDNCRVDRLEHGYKELSLAASPGGQFQLREDCLHIWPRGGWMLIALPNLDRSFTCTLFYPLEGPSSFASLNSPEAVNELFDREFADLKALMPDLLEQFEANPVGHLATVTTQRWTLADRLLLIGDAAHAVVPFFGQGMNASFEDALELAWQHDKLGEDWAAVFEGTARARKANSDAIAAMALENYVEMRNTVADPGFQLRKHVEHRLEHLEPERFLSRYSMVSFSTVPYRLARERGRIQQELLEELTAGMERIGQLDEARSRALIHERLVPLADLPRS